MDHAKIARLQALAKQNGRTKGQPRRSTTQSSHSQQQDYERYLEKAELINVSSSDEVNLFTTDGKVIHHEGVNIRATMLNNKPIFYCMVQNSNGPPEARDVDMYLPQILDHLDKTQIQAMEENLDDDDD